VIFASVGSDGPTSAEVARLVTREEEQLAAPAAQSDSRKRDNV
jgi:hypothetical protein